MLLKISLHVRISLTTPISHGWILLLNRLMWLTHVRFQHSTISTSCVGVNTQSAVSFSLFTKTEPLSHTENGMSNEESAKDAASSNRSLHTTSDYRAAKKERPYYPGQTHTPPPLRRVSSNPTEVGPMAAHRRVEGIVSFTWKLGGKKHSHA